ncbi:hypothetical protein [Miniimonas arenae]|uniref:hypothetical protein n=1 Tax=Miniimonas arenae TaxID=676201 RepID=UPI0028AEBB50|nr:hypothetical protein [Miniimonas arenae]
MATDLLSNVLRAQTRNGQLAGDDLLHAARSLIDILRSRGATAVPSDSVGDRILGAALLLEPALSLLDRSRRMDGSHVVLVAGHLSGDARVAARALSARALGAVSVEAAVLGPWRGSIDGCDEVWSLGSERHLKAVP